MSTFFRGMVLMSPHIMWMRWFKFSSLALFLICVVRSSLSSIPMQLHPIFWAAVRRISPVPAPRSTRMWWGLASAICSIFSAAFGFVFAYGESNPSRHISCVSTALKT